MSNEVAEAHQRGAEILKLRRVVAGEQSYSPLMEEVGLLYGLRADEIIEILSVGATVILQTAGIPAQELTSLEIAEAALSEASAYQHVANHEG